jgi:CRISPR-associated protein Csx17
LFANKTDVIEFLERRLDEALIEDLIFAFLVAKLPDWREVKDRELEAEGKPWLRWATYSVLKQLFASQTHPATNAPADEPRFRPDLAITGLLQGGQVARATAIALRRLQIEGVRPILSKGWDSEDGVRLGAALLIPVWGVKTLRDAVTRDEERTEVVEER